MIECVDSHFIFPFLLWNMIGDYRAKRIMYCGNDIILSKHYIDWCRLFLVDFLSHNIVKITLQIHPNCMVIFWEGLPVDFAFLSQLPLLDDGQTPLLIPLFVWCLTQTRIHWLVHLLLGKGSKKRRRLIEIKTKQKQGQRRGHVMLVKENRASDSSIARPAMTFYVLPLILWRFLTQFPLSGQSYSHQCPQKDFWFFLFKLEYVTPTSSHLFSLVPLSYLHIQWPTPFCAGLMPIIVLSPLWFRILHLVFLFFFLLI